MSLIDIRLLVMSNYFVFFSDFYVINFAFTLPSRRRPPMAGPSPPVASSTAASSPSTTPPSIEQLYAPGSSSVIADPMCASPPVRSDHCWAIAHHRVDEMADNTCHFGINSFFPDSGLSDVRSWRPIHCK
ncbi:hypothetical protein HD554DRAFT_1073598 [Boletus coccyginus]|nr:hypothetical protein HD554DRAFT_1073598 [Boletus coccyginus]